MRLVIVIRANLAEQANAIIGAWTPGGERTFTNALYRNSDDALVAYWCNWDFAGTRHDARALATRFIDLLGLTEDEVGTRTTTTGANLATKKMVAFDASAVTPDQFLAFADLHVASDA